MERWAHSRAHDHEENTMEQRRSTQSVSLGERIYRTPELHVIAAGCIAAVALFLILTLLFFILGGTFYTETTEDGITYRYFGLMNDNSPVWGTFKGTDGSGGSVFGKKVKYKDGSVYRGKLYYLDPEGEGTLTTKAGDVYSGTFSGGKLSGKGQVEYADGSSFYGSFKDGLFDGYGEITYADGSSYAGDFLEGEKSGYGEFIYPDGSVYKGQFEMDMRHGSGDYRFASGDRYQGTFSYNVINGYGTYIFHSGRTFSGQFMFGVPQV